MATVTRTVPTGTITNAEQLQLELREVATAIGSLCEGVGITTGAPDDTIVMLFAGAADGTEVDTVLAAHPSYTMAELPASMSLTANTWTTVYRRPLAEGETLELDATITVTNGDATTVEAATVHIDEHVRRRTGQAAFVASQGGAQRRYGEIPSSAARYNVSGNYVEIQFRSARTATVSIDGEIHVESKVLA